MASRYIHRSHNVSVLMYHVGCAAKYRRVVMSERVDEVLKGACLEIEKRWEIWFLEIGVERDHARFLVQSAPMYRPTKIVQTVKSVTAREVFAKAPEVKSKRWGGEFWGKGYFVNTVGQQGSEKVIAESVKRQGKAGNYRMRMHGRRVPPETLRLRPDRESPRARSVLRGVSVEHRIASSPLPG